MNQQKTRDFRQAPSGFANGEPPFSPAGKPLTLADLPPPNTKRWVIRRKAEVVAGVHAGIISLSEACHRYRLSVDEFRSWERLLESHGVAGLRVTRVRQYRPVRRPANIRPATER
jgi:hypothetical protein